MKMQSIRLIGVVLVVQCAALPSPFVLQPDANDGHAIGSTRQEVRAVAPAHFARTVSDLVVAGNSPRKHNKKVIKNAKGKSDEENYFRTYGDDADGEKGYEKQTHSKRNQGYKTRDTFHKQDGDNYGFEEHEAFGHARGKEDETGQAKSSKHKSKHADHEGAGTYLDSYYVDGDDHAGYSDGGDDGDGSYEHSAGESYSSGYSRGNGDDDGSYETHSSYTSDGDGSNEDYY